MFDVPAIILFVIVIALLLAPPGSSKLPELEINSVAPATLRAERNLLVEDKAVTALRREAAAKEVPATFDYDSELYFALGERVFGASELLRNKSQEPVSTQRDNFSKALGVDVSPGIFKLLLNLEEPADMAVAITFFLNLGLDRMIVAERAELPPEGHIQIRDVALKRTEVRRHTGRIIDLRQLRRSMTARAGDAPYDSARIVRTWILDTAQDLAAANLKKNEIDTQAQRKQAVDAVQPVFLRIEASEVLIRKGDRVSAPVVEKIRLLNAHSDGGPRWRETFALAGLLAAIVALSAVFFRRGRTPLTIGRKNAYLTLTIAGGTTAISLAMYFASLGIADGIGFDANAAAYFMPLALATILVAILVDARTSLLVGVALTLLMAFRVNGDLALVTYYIVGVLVAGVAARGNRRRTDLLRVGFLVAMAQMAVYPAATILAGNTLDVTYLPYFVAALVSGTLVGVGALASVAILELLFDETTDPRLLELASADNPLLKELALKAPGTFYHSTMVANLAEAGADSIGANGLMCRVMAMYHDIGKMKRPSYFSENQRAGDNIHDRLAPEVSARVLYDHVADGIQMAKQARIGGVILEGIAQHQGTSLLHRFYEKARSQGYNGPPDDFRYPGPRPKRREAGILLLADSTEAATRALKDTSPSAVRERVSAIISERVNDGQLDECGLTLKDIAQLEETFTRTLTLGAFHNRIEYPPIAHGGETKDHGPPHRDHVAKRGLADKSA
jgi:putative nucleotidyltransferase with HDIG domain